MPGAFIFFPGPIAALIFLALYHTDGKHNPRHFNYLVRDYTDGKKLLPLSNAWLKPRFSRHSTDGKQETALTIKYATLPTGNSSHFHQMSDLTLTRFLTWYRRKKKKSSHHQTPPYRRKITSATMKWMTLASPFLSLYRRNIQRSSHHYQVRDLTDGK